MQSFGPAVRPTTGFLCFCQSKSAGIAGDGVPVLTPALATEWSGLTAERRRGFEVRAQILNSQYDSLVVSSLLLAVEHDDTTDDDAEVGEEVEEDLEDGGEAQGNERRGPKRAKTAYLCFTRSRFAEASRELSKTHSGKDLATAVVRRLAEVWKTLSIDEKRPYESEAARDAERFRNEVAQTRGGVGVVASNSATSGKKRPVPDNAFGLFCRENRHAARERLLASSSSDSPSQEAVSKELTAMWLALSDAQKLPYLCHRPADAQSLPRRRK